MYNQQAPGEIKEDFLEEGRWLTMGLIFLPEDCCFGCTRSKFLGGFLI